MTDNVADLMNEAVGSVNGLHLEVSGGNHEKPSAIELPHPFAILGHTRRANVALTHASVSYRHAYLQVVDGRVFCLDLDSKKGTLWGNERRPHGWVLMDDQLRVGPYTLRLVEDPGGPHAGSDDVLANPFVPDESANWAAPRYEIEFVDDRAEDAVLAIDRGITIIGRQAGCAIRLNDDDVSRMHCAVVRTATSLWVVDLLGKEGTFVDGKRVRFAMLENGAELAVGKHRMCVWQRRRKGSAEKSSAPLPNGAGSADAESFDREGREWLGTLFTIEQRGHTLIVVPTISGNMFRYAKLQTEANALRRRLESSAIRGLIVDLHALDYVGSEVIGAVVALARKAEDTGGRAVLCRPTPQLREAMMNMGLHRLWEFYGTREEALDAITAEN